MISDDFHINVVTKTITVSTNKPVKYSIHDLYDHLIGGTAVNLIDNNGLLIYNNGLIIYNKRKYSAVAEQVFLRFE